MVSSSTGTMGTHNRENGATSLPDREDEELDTQQLKELAGFVLRAPRRRPRLSIFVFVVTLGLGVFISAFWPRAYLSSMRILAQRNTLLPALDNPNRNVPHEADSPTKNAADTITKRDNIIALMNQLDILDRWAATRQPILHLKDVIFLAIYGPRPEEERRLDLIGLLEKRLTVATDDSSINVSIEWPDRQMAFDIMALVQKNFLEARYDSNVSVIEDAIRILEERAKPQSQEVDAALEELSKLDAARRRMPAPTVGASVRSGTSSGTALQRSGASPSGDSTGDSARELEEVRRSIRALEDENRRHLAEAQNQLVDARATLGPLHPTVVALNEKVAQLGASSPELATLHARERELVAKIAKGLEAPPPQPGQHATAPGASAPAPGGASEIASTPGSAPRDSMERLLDLRDDPQTALARSKLQAASAKYNELLSRIEAARIELDVTRASFKYQYTIVKPPELARRPSKPNVTLVMIASFLLALLLMVLVPAALDLSRGRFVEAWQVERHLKLPVLGELLLERK
jgi:uncharacterized protein involved in exopolysaccharide biosynthesis